MALGELVLLELGDLCRLLLYLRSHFEDVAILILG